VGPWACVRDGPFLYPHEKAAAHRLGSACGKCNGALLRFRFPYGWHEAWSVGWRCPPVVSKGGGRSAAEAGGHGDWRAPPPGAPASYRRVLFPDRERTLRAIPTARR